MSLIWGTVNGREKKKRDVVKATRDGDKKKGDGGGKGNGNGNGNGHSLIWDILKSIKGFFKNK